MLALCSKEKISRHSKLCSRGAPRTSLRRPFPGAAVGQTRLASAADRTKFVPGVRLHDAKFPKGSTTVKVSVYQGTWWALVGQPVEPEAFLQRSHGCTHPACALPPAASLGEDSEQPKQPTPV